MANPSRLYGTTQFMGVGSIDQDAGTTAEDGAEDPPDCGGLCFAYSNFNLSPNIPISYHISVCIG